MDQMFVSYWNTRKYFLFKDVKLWNYDVYLLYIDLRLGRAIKIGNAPL